MATSPQPNAAEKTVSRNPVRRAVTGFLLLLAAGFLLRLIENAYHWLAGHSSAAANYKALTAWCLIYLVVCGGLAWLSHRLPAGEDRSPE